MPFFDDETSILRRFQSKGRYYHWIGANTAHTTTTAFLMEEDYMKRPIKIEYTLDHEDMGKLLNHIDRLIELNEQMADMLDATNERIDAIEKGTQSSWEKY